MAMAETRWWIYDRPLRGDPMFVLAMLLGVIGMVGVLINRDSYGSAAFVFALATSIPWALLAVGIVGGSIREYLRGRRERDR